MTALAVGAVLLGSAFVAAVCQGLTGFAFALVAAGAFLQVRPPAAAVPLVLACSLTGQLISLVSLRHGMRWNRLWPFLIGGIVGVPFGVFILKHADASALRLAVGAFLIVYSLYMLVAPQPRPIATGGQVADGAVGLAGGVLGGLMGFSGALPTIWCGLRGWPKDEQRGVFQPFIVVVHVVAIISLGSVGLAKWGTLIDYLICLPGLLIGVWLGLRLYRQANERQFRRIVLWVLLVAGVSLAAA